MYRFDPKLASPRKFPATGDGCFFFYDWERHWIVAAWVNDAGDPVRFERFAPEIRLKRPSEMELGRYGALYLNELGTGWEGNADAQLVRIEGGPGA